MDSLVQDIRDAARSLRRNPGFSLVVILTLALGIGTSTTMFTLVNSVLLRPLEVQEPERLVMVFERNRDRDPYNSVAPANFFDWKEQAQSFTDLAALTDQPLNLTGDGEAEQVRAQLTTANFFSVLGVRAALGRTYRTGEDAEAVVVLSNGLWQRRFNSDPSIIGRTIRLNDQPQLVVGVMPANFPSITSKPDLWATTDPDRKWRGRYLRVVGRLRPGTTVEQAQAEMDTVSQRLTKAYPEFLTNWGINVVSIQEQVTRDVRRALLVLLGAVGLLLMIACANVANLLLGKAASRRREITVRLSLGATRLRLIRRVLTESVLLAAISGAVGVLVAVWGTRILVRFLPSDLAFPRMDEVSVDARVLGFAVAISVLTGILFGIAPALSTSAVNLATTLREAMRGTTGARSRLRSALVIAEVALAVVLLVGAGLLGRSLQRLLDADTGLRTNNVLTARLTMAGARYQQQAALRNFMDELLPRLDALPGAVSVGGVMYLPLTGQKIGHTFTIDDRPPWREGEEPSIDLRPIAGDYHRTLGVPLLRGRFFNARDNEKAPPVFIVNDVLARQHFSDREPIGQRISYEWDGFTSGEIVGVVGSVREMGPAAEPAAAIYVPFAQLPLSQMTVVMRTSGDPLAMASAVRAVVRDLDPNQPIADIRSMEEVAANTVARQRLNVYLLGGFAGVALLLAALGLYGIVSYSVTQRRAEIGVRVALGAQRGDVVRFILREGLALTIFGLFLGIVTAVAITRVMATLLFDVAPTDPLTLGMVSAFLTIVALLASYIPARRATRVDPMVALRE